MTSFSICGFVQGMKYSWSLGNGLSPPQRMRNSLQNILGLVNNLDAHLFRPAIRFAEVRETYRSRLSSHGSNTETVGGHSRQLHKHLRTLRTAYSGGPVFVTVTITNIGTTNN